MFQEALLEPIARQFRFNAVIDKIPRNIPITVLDLGCGPQIRFYHQALSHKILFNKYIGIDPLIDKKILTQSGQGSLELMKKSLNRSIPLPDKSVDYVVSFAFLEHIDHPQALLAESVRILKKGGKALFTTPTPLAKGILEFLSFKLGVISRREIAEHKNYFDRDTLFTLTKGLSINFDHSYFEFGLNNILTLVKK